MKISWNSEWTFCYKNKLVFTFPWTWLFKRPSKRYFLQYNTQWGINILKRSFVGIDSLRIDVKNKIESSLFLLKRMFTVNDEKFVYWWLSLWKQLLWFYKEYFRVRRKNFFLQKFLSLQFLKAIKNIFVQLCVENQQQIDFKKKRYS